MTAPELVIDILLDPEFEIESTSTAVDVEVPEPILAVITVEGPKGDPGDRGPAGDGAQVFGEILTGANGGKVTFDTANPFAAGSTAVYLNGLRETSGDAYVESGANTVTFDEPPLDTDSVRIDYLIA